MSEFQRFVCEEFLGVKLICVLFVDVIFLGLFGGSDLKGCVMEWSLGDSGSDYFDCVMDRSSGSLLEEIEY